MSPETRPPFAAPPGNTDSPRFPMIPHMIPAVSQQLPSTFPVPPPIGGNRETGRPHRTQHFTANTCRKCAAIVITGTTHGLHLDLEPTTLNDHTEYQALADGIPTYDLWPDRTARRRHLEEIKHPERVPRHARHTCGTTYGTDPRPDPSTQPSPTTSDSPPF